MRRRRLQREVERQRAEAVRIEPELQRRELLEALARRRGEGIGGVDRAEDVAAVGEDVERVSRLVLGQVGRRVDLRQRVEPRVIREAPEEVEVGEIFDVDHGAEAARQIVLCMFV